jgi:Flp pilus assembly protein TadG
MIAIRSSSIVRRLIYLVDLLADERGNAAIMTALVSPVILGFAGLAIDASMWQINKRDMQGAADQSALAAVVAYQAGAGADPVTAANAVAQRFGFTNGTGGVNVTVNKVQPPTLGYDVDYKVTISQPQPELLER